MNNQITYAEILKAEAEEKSKIENGGIEVAVAQLRKSERGQEALAHLWEMIDSAAYGFDDLNWEAVIAVARDFQKGEDAFARMRDAMGR